MSKPKPPALDPATLPVRRGTGYPAPFDAISPTREKRVLGDALGLKNFGVNLVRLPPGEGSSQRHWHSHEDEFVYIVEGELTLITDEGEQVLGPGMVAGFPAGAPNGHHLVNKSDRDGVYLEVGDRIEADEGAYPDIDMLYRIVDGRHIFTHKDGTPYPERE